MTAVEDTKRQAIQLCAQARSARSQARDIRARTLLLAAATAATEEQLAGTIDRLAEQRPECAERLRAMSESARGYAARERGRLALHAGGSSHGADQPVIEDRIPAPLRDTVIQRVFAAGLSLQSAVGLTQEPEVCWRIEAAADVLDQVIREIRTAAFQDPRLGPHAGPDFPDLGEQLATTASIRVSRPAGGAIPAGDSVRLLVILRRLLAMIGEHATPSSVDIAAEAGFYHLAIEAVPLSSGAPASWFSVVQAGAGRAGISLAIDPAPGSIRFTGRLPAGLRR